MKHTVKSFLQFTQEQINSVISQHFVVNKAPVEIQGTLGPLNKNGDYKILYDVRLFDGQEYISLNIPRTLIDKHGLEGGEEVSVSGFIRTKMDEYTNFRVEFKVEVSKIEASEIKPEAFPKSSEVFGLSALREIEFSRNAFPFEKRQPTIGLITGKSSEVELDFKREIKFLGSSVEVEKIPVNMLSAPEIIKAINNSRHDILVLVRGGGEEYQFDLFNQQELIEAMAAHNGYRIAGLGHSKNVTLVEFVCDYSANTPAQAGVHIRETLSKYKDQCDSRVRAISSEMEKRFNEKAAAANIRSNDIRQESQEKQASKSTLASRIIKWIIFLICAGILVKFFW